MDMNQRMIELETKISYQEHLLQELNDVIVLQQKEITSLQVMQERMLKQMKALSPSQLARPEEESPPPHY